MKNIETSKKVSRANNVNMCANKEHKELDQTKIVIRELFLYYASKFDETKEYLGDYFMRPAVKVNLMNIFTNIAPNELKTITELIVSNKQLALYIQQYIPDVLVHLKKTADCVESMFYDIFCLNNKVFELLILDLILFSIKSRNELSSYFFITYLNKKLRKLNRFNTYSPNNDQDVNFEDVNLFCLFKNEEIASIKKSEDGTYKFVYSHEEVAEQKFYVVLGKESYSVSYQIMDLMGLLVIPFTLISNLSEKLTYKLKSNKILLNFYTISSNLTNVQISSQDNIKQAYLSSVKHLNRSSQQKYKLHLFKAEKKIKKDNLVKLTKNQPTSLNCMTDTSINSSVNRMSATVEKDLNQEILPMVSDFRVALNSYPKCEVECQLICISKPKFIKLIYSLWQSNKMIASLKNGGDVSRLLSVLKGDISIEKLYSDDNPRYVGTLSSEFIKCKTCECAKLKSVQKGLLYGLLDFLILG